MPLTLFVPELLWPEPADEATYSDLACPGLERLLARSHVDVGPVQPEEHALSSLFGHKPGTSHAAFRLLGETAPIDPASTTWMAADPVHLRFHQDRLVLADASQFELGPDTARDYVAALNVHFGDLGRFHAVAPERWYLEVSDTMLTAHSDLPPLSAVAGRGVDQILSGATDARELRRSINEVQMLLHTLPLNAKRERAGLLPINSLWLWGAGPLPERRESDFDGVWSAAPLPAGFARAAGVPSHRLPVDARRLFEHAAADSHHLVVLDQLLRPVQYENAAAYRTVLADLDRDWFMPLGEALRKGQIDRLHLVAPTAFGTLTADHARFDAWKLWRRPTPLRQLAEQLASQRRKDEAA